MEKKIHLGELLKENREKKSLTLEDVARITKIRIEFLKALENESYSDLPERTYSLGYFRAYANFLGINNVESLVKKLDETYSFSSPEYLQSKGQVFLDEEYSLINTFKKKIAKEQSSEEAKEEVKETKEKKQKKQKVEHLEEGGFTSQKKLIIVLGVFLVIFLFLGYKILTGNDSSEDENEIVEAMVVETTPSENKALNSVMTNDFVVVENKPENKPEQNTAPVVEEQKQNEFDGSQGDSPVAEEEAKEEITKTPKIEVKYTSWPKQTRNYQISVAFAEDVWVQIYKKDDPSVVYLDKIFKAGDIYDIPKVEDISMRVGNYKGVKILVDSKEIVLTSKRRVSVVLADIVLEKNSLLEKYPLASRE